MSIDLFEPYRIGRMKLRNRFVRSATWDGLADSSGAVTDESVALYQELGRGGVGLIIGGHAFISAIGRTDRNQYGVHTDDMIPGLSRMTQAAHKGGAQIALQINHTGGFPDILPEDNIARLAVSRTERLSRPHREMTDEEIEVIISEFASAAVRVREAGFDAVQFHGAHCYLMSQFLSPLYNLRTDKWGGSAENRRRFHLEVIRRVYQAVGADFPILIKLGVQDDEEGGLTLSESLATARHIVEEGIAAIEVSMGMSSADVFVRPAKKGAPEQAYLRELAAAVKRAVTVPVMAVGGIRSLEMAQSIVDSGDADLISMCRPFIREPDLIGRWQRGERQPAKCTSCKRCIFTAAKKGVSVLCWQERHFKGEK